MVNNSNIPVKRTSEGIETTKVLADTTLASVNVGANTATSPISSVFPVKIVLKKTFSEIEIHELDKENIDPFTGAPIEWDDLDAEDSGDPLMVSDYVVEIFDYMKQLEVKMLTRNLYLSFLLLLLHTSLETSSSKSKFNFKTTILKLAHEINFS